MAYLLKEFDDDRAARRRRQQEEDGGSIFRSVISALHGTPLRPSTEPNRQQQPSARGASAASLTGASGAVGSSAREPSASTAVPPSSPSPAAMGVSEAELYRTAVDLGDILSIISAPTQPPSRHGFATAGAVAGGGGGSVLAPDLLTSLVSSGMAGGNGAWGTSLPPSPSSEEGGLVFHRIADDATTGVEVFSAPVKDFPIHLMRATAIMPCSPSQLLQYMDNDIRPRWDTYLRESRIVRELPPSLDAAAAASPFPSLSRSLLTQDWGTARVRETSLAAEGRGARETERQHVRSEGGRSGTAARVLARPPPSLTLPPSLFSHDRPFAFLPGQRRVALHYLGVRSPVLFVQDRDFELVVSESVLPDGTAVMKAFSAPRGTGMPLDPAQTRYVRGVVVLSGIVARPLRIPTAPEQRTRAEQVIQQLPASLRGVASAELAACDAKRASPNDGGRSIPNDGHPQRSALSQKGERGGGGGVAHAREERGEALEYCALEYFGLVHPLGLIPPQIVNVVISAQTSTLKKLQSFVAAHPLASLRPTPVPVPEWKQRRARERELAAAQEKQGKGGTQGAAASHSQPSSPSPPLASASARGSTEEEEGDGASWWKRMKGRVLSKL